MNGKTTGADWGTSARLNRHWMRTLAPLLLAVCASSAQGGEVVRWVDEKGLTHFGDRQLAPLQADIETVDIAPANGMVPAVAPPFSATGGGPRVVTLKLEGKRNKKGWRSGGETLYTGRRHQSNGYR